jgi:adenosylcobyric acid synthase
MRNENTDRLSRGRTPARALMFQGTGSDVGKSLIVAGLCRAYASRGLAVRPFKPQNMSNNAAVTIDGGEIGRAQALQARACGTPATVHMNPVLLKPQSDVGSQVVVQGRVVGNAKARDYQAWKPKLMASVLESFAHLRSEADLVLIEGAGSAAELNLRRNDIANMGFARAADTPVVLIGDIDRGGVIAQIVGTKAVIDADDAAMIAGFLVNRFRGDPSLFDDGMRIIAERTGWPALGLIPYFAAASRLPAEDALALRQVEKPGNGAVTIAVPMLPHIANFDDFDPLKIEPGARLVMVKAGEPLPGDADLVILPGSKATIADLAEFRRQGWDIDLNAHVRRGGRVLGVCGGYQMLGRQLSDPDGIEGPAGTISGLGLLDVETMLMGDKALRSVSGVSLADGAPFQGYEMHIGKTSGPDCERPLLRFADGRVDGATSDNGQIRASYVHGLFNDDRQRAAWLDWLGSPSSGVCYEAGVERILDELAVHLERHVDLDRVFKLAR